MRCHVMGRVSNPQFSRCSFTLPMGTSLRWKMPAASSAVGFATRRHSEKWTGAPAPDDAITGMETALTMSATSSAVLENPKAPQINETRHNETDDGVVLLGQQSFCLTCLFGLFVCLCQPLCGVSEHNQSCSDAGETERQRDRETEGQRDRGTERQRESQVLT